MVNITGRWDVEDYQDVYLCSDVEAILPVWVSVDERLPEKKCVATYLNSHDKRRTIIAIYCPRFTIESSGEAEDYDEYYFNTDTCYFKEGWYECQENWGEYAMIYVNEGEVTHWMPLPPAPTA